MEVFLFSFRLFVFQLNRPAVQLESFSFGGGMRSLNFWWNLSENDLDPTQLEAKHFSRGGFGLWSACGSLCADH